MKSFMHFLAEGVSLPGLRSGRLSLLVMVLVVPGLFLCGCYGDFALTKALYEFNGDVSPSGFIQSAVLWVLGFLWVYSIAIFLDVVIFNLIEFWTLENPISMAQTIEGPDGQEVVMTPSEGGQEVRIDLKKEGQVVETRHVRKTDRGEFEIQDGQGTQVGNVRKLDNGDLELSRPDTEETRVLPREALEEFTAQAPVAFAG